MSVGVYEQLKDDLGYLQLGAAAERFAVLAEQASQQGWSHVEFLAKVMAEQVAATTNRRLAARMRYARFPFRRTIDDFDFDFQPSVDRKLVADLTTLRFIAENRPLLFLGQPGCGKTHCETQVHRSVRCCVTHHSPAARFLPGLAPIPPCHSEEDPMGLADQVDFVIGVDTHKYSHTVGLVDRTGAELGSSTFATDAFGYRRILTWAEQLTTDPQRRCWAVEGTGSFGAGLVTHLLEHGEWVVEIDRPARPARRNGAKSDTLDAYRAAREALSRAHLAQPRRRGTREAIRVLLCTREGAVRSRTRALCHLQALIVSAPTQLRDQLRRHPVDVQVERCARLRILAEHSLEHRSTIRALRATARRVQFLTAEADDLEAELELLVAQEAPELLAEPGVGTISAAQILNAWSHAGRLRSEAAFAMMAGAAPIPASSGQITRYRLNRGGDRQLNRALHTIVLSRIRFHPETKVYVARRAAEGRTPREIKRCLKRFVARRLYRILEHPNTVAPPVPAVA